MGYEVLPIKPLVLTIGRSSASRTRCSSASVAAPMHGRHSSDTFGLTAGKDYGFDMTVNLRIQVEVLKNR